jgi:hypothetical protein
MKYLFVLMLIFLSPLLMDGQTQLGGKAGYIFYGFTTPTDDHTTYDYCYSHNAFAFAASLKSRSESVFNIGGELVYKYRAFNVKSNTGGLGGGTSVDYHYSLGNIYLRILPEFSFKSNITFFVYPGIYFGTRLHSSVTGTKGSWSLPNHSSTDTVSGSASGYYPNFEFGLIIGMGIEIPLGKDLCAVAESNCSMNILPIATAWGSGKIKMIDLSLELGIAYTFPGRKEKTQHK